MNEPKKSLTFRFLRRMVLLFYRRYDFSGLENLPEEPVILAGNHSQMNGPLVGELFMPFDCRIWCAGQLMHADEVQPYAYQDFWSYKPRYIRWFYKLLSYAIVPLSVRIFRDAHTIGVYRDMRIIRTFRDTVRALQNGENVIIFPEHDQECNHILCDFQTKFVDTARFYYRSTGKELSFVPMYIAPRLKTVYFMKPIRFCHDAPIEEERSRICRYLMEQITETACSLPEHTVIPYRNVSRKLYHSNIR